MQTVQYMIRRWRLFGFAAALIAWSLPAVAALPVEARGSQFISLKSFAEFTKKAGERKGEVVLTSPEIVAQIKWNELVLSWNANAPTGAVIKFEARGIAAGRVTKYYTMAVWSSESSQQPRTSVRSQRDEDGDVDTDTLTLKDLADTVQLRITMWGPPMGKPSLKFLGISLADTGQSPSALTPNNLAWGKVIPVVERSQMAYPNGNVLCSATTVSMLMNWWAQSLNRPELDRDVPEVARAVYDASWKGTGNWAFNMAYPGSFDGIRSYVTRFSDVSEIEDWIAQGIPIGLSLSYDKLRGKEGNGNGHLVVCVGFTETGDPITNDPGTSTNVRKVFPRANLVKAWGVSHNTVYIIHPEEVSVPADRFGHWDSWAAHQRIRFQQWNRPEKIR